MCHVALLSCAESHSQPTLLDDVVMTLANKKTNSVNPLTLTPK